MHRNRFVRPAIKLGATALGVVLGTAGLAVAGVNLPDPADEAFERAGISLPNQAGGGDAQGDENSRSDEVQAVIDATPPSERGCEFGHRVAEAARGEPLPEAARDACDKGENGDGQAQGKGKGKGKANNGSANGAGHAFGQDTADRARGLKDATPQQRRQFGEDTADRAKQLGGDPQGTPGPNAQSGPPDDGTPSGPPEDKGAPDDTPKGPPAGRP
jgi:hypothetical protein